MNLKTQLKLGVIGLTLSGLSAYAQVFNYTDGDLILDFSAAGYSDVEVDIGNISNLVSTAKSAGGSVQISAYNVSSQLLGNFGGVDSLSFSVVGVQNNDSGSIAAGTVYLTQAQPGANPITPPKDVNNTAQAALEGTVLAILGSDGFGGLTVRGILPWSAGNPADPVNNTASVAIIPTSGVQGSSSYTKIVGASFTGAPSNPKHTTSATFSAGGSIVSDIFEFDPTGVTTQSTIYLGYFTFNSDGTLVFSVPAPPSTTITSITAGSGTVTVKFNTVVGTNYRLRYSTQLNVSRSSWTILTGSVVGTGATGTLTDPSATDTTRFYTVESY